MFNRYQLFALSLLLGSNMVAATTIYKWVDENGVTHYTEQPPEKDGKAQVIKAADIEQKRIGFESPKPQAKADEPQTDEQKNADLIRQQNAEQADAICEQAKQNQEVLENFNRVTRKDAGTNEPVVMTDEEREAALADSKKRVELFCKESGGKAKK
ncbi:DUF4124 domain-containing protein [Shewanella sp. JM162201]|uniref:DUF4124 domain-containing protein n=1 Tax=Shewanella jiangmenensis TaxID=2837387 RepID=A0ABS5V4K1_9GAMM|nr:DUF4124 domain-containing protein [Shewanella jiangmenensis]MBT1444619.1 DUF4124 domain-containing protein [Shewanella jiangmenensis]